MSVAFIVTIVLFCGCFVCVCAILYGMAIE